MGSWCIQFSSLNIAAQACVQIDQKWFPSNHQIDFFQNPKNRIANRQLNACKKSNHKSNRFRKNAEKTLSCFYRVSNSYLDKLTSILSMKNVHKKLFFFFKSQQLAVIIYRISLIWYKSFGDRFQSNRLEKSCTKNPKSNRESIIGNENVFP